MSGERVLVVVPTYDEVANLGAVLDRLHAAVPTAHALVVDDASPDGTGELADARAATDERVHVLHRTAKAGLGPAYVAGFSWAAEHGYAVVVEMDADGSVVHRSELFTPDTFVEQIAQRDSRTVAERLGAAPEWLLTALGAGAVLALAVPALSRRRAARRNAR